MLQLHLLVLCMVGIVLADSTQPDLSQSLFTWSCSSDSIIPCDVSMAVCHSSTGIPGCRTGTYTYPTLVCLSIPAGIPVEEKLCNPFHRPAPAPCTESSSCVARCRATADDFLDSCDHPSTWKCNDVDAQQCGWSCSSASRDVYCSDGSVAVDINMCENLPSTTGSDVPYGTCDPFLAPSTAVTIAHLNSGNGISVEWTSFASDVEYVVEVSFNSAAASLVSRPYCSVPASESGPSLSTECMLSFLPSGDARLRIKMNGDAASRTRVLVSFTPTLPCSPSGASAVASVMLPHRTIGVSAPIEFTNGEHVPFPDAGSTSANHAFHLETYNTVTGVSRGWLIGDYSRPDGSNLFGKTVILKSFIVSFDESVSMSKEDTKCGIVIGTSLATSMSDAVDINFVSVFYPDNHKVRLEPSSQITVPAGTKSIGIVCSAITALKLGSFPVKVEMFSATTSYGMGQGLMTVARSPSPNTVSIFGPEEQNPKGIFLKHSISAVYTKGVAYSSPSAPAQSVHQYILNSESAAFVRASHRSYAAKRAHLDPNGALWGSQMTIGLAGEPACVIASGDGLPVPCGVVCGAVTRVCAAHGLVQPLEMCVSPVWPAAESACEGTAVAPTSVQLRLGGGELQITAEALEIHVPTIVNVKLADTFNIYLDHLLLCSQAPLSMTRWCRVSGPVASVSMLLPPASGTFTRTGSLSLDSGYPTFACTGSSASVSMSLPTSNGRTISRLPATPTALALNCAAGEAVAAPVVGRPSVAAFAPTSTVGSKGSLFLAFTVDKSALSTQVIRDRIGAISSVTLSGISSISDLSGCTRVRSYTGFDAFDPFWFVKPNGFSTSAVSEQITSETATMSAELDINIYQGKGSLTVGLVFEGVGISSTKDTLISPVLTLKNSNGMSFNLGSTSFEVALSVSPHPEVTISGDLAVVVATIPAAEGRIIDGPKLSHALGINDVEYASWQTGSDGGFVFSVTVPTSDMWIAAAAVAPSVMNKVLHTSAAVQHGVIVPSAPCKVDIFAPDTYTCLSSETFVAAPCPPRPTSCDAADFGYSLACGTAISAQDPRFQACRSATLPEAFDFCKNTMDIGGVAISEGEGDSRGIVLASYALSKGGSIANLRPLFLILGGMEHLGPIASCTIASESKPIACGIDSDGKLRIAVSHGLRELASAPITIKPKMRSYLSHAAAVSVSAYNSKGELAFMFTETATVASRIPQAQDPETKATGGISVAGDGSVTAWVHATTTASDFNPPGSLLKMAVLRVSDFSRFETATKCISVVGTASMTNSSPWPASNMFVSNVKSGELYFQKDANANSMGGSVFIPLPENVAPFTSVYIACTGLKMSPTSFTVHGMLFSSASNDENKIEGGISLTPPNGLFTNLFNPSSPAPDDTEIRIKFEISPATAILSAEARNTIAASIIGFTDDYIGARVQSTPGSVVVLVGVSGVFPSLETAFMGDGIAVPSAITSAIQAGFAADGDNTVTVTPSAGIELGYGFIWRCFSPSGSADVCQISNRCGSALKYARACAAVQANGSIVAATNEADCAHLPAPWTRDVSGCGTAFSAPSVRRAGGTTVAVSFDVDLVHVPDSPSLTVAISVPDTVSRGLVCTTSSTSAVIDDCRASANGNMIVRISDASFTQDSAESVVNGWNYYPFTVYFHNVDLSAWSMKAPTVSSVTVSMPSRLQSNVLAEGISAVSLTGFNTLRGNVEAVSAVYNFQGGTIGSGTLTISVAAPIGSMLFDGAIDYVSITSTSSRLSFDTCRIMAIERSSQNQWPASKSLKDTVIYKNHGNNRGTEIKFIDAVNDPSFALVTCGVGMDEPSFDVTVVFTTNKGTRYSIPRALAVDSRVQVQYLETTSSSIGTSVRVTCNDEIAPDFSIDRLKTTIKQIKGFYPDSTNSKVGVFHLSLFSDNAFSASLVMPGTLVGLVQLMKSVDAQFTDATASPIAPVINEGEWRCGPYISDVCATNACRPRFDNVGCYVGMTSVQKEQCRHLPYPVPNTDGCGVYKCRSRDGLGYVDCNDSEVCVEGCRDLEVPFFPALASSSRLSKPVCLRNGQQANAEVFCPLETVASPVFSTSCSPRSSCELKCKDSSGAIQSCEDESTWSDCSSTECGVTGTQERFFLCTDSSVTDGSNSSSIPSSLCDHIPTARTQECSPALCDGWRCAASNTDTFADCKLDSTWPNCPVSGCTKENKVSRVFKCFSKDNVEVSDENCTEDDPITSKNCPLVTDQCNPTFEGSQCNLDYMGEFDFSADPNCLPEGAENPYQRGSCVDSKNAVVNSTWCTPGSLLRQCSLPACGSDSPITYEWSSTPGPCIATDVRCATLRPKTVVCMAVQDGGRTVTDDSFCNQKRRPAKFEACDSDEGVSCGSSGVCDQSHPAQDANGDLVPGMTMGFCACNDEMHFGPSCDDIVAFTSVEVNGSVQDGFHLAWSLSKTISSMMVRVTVQPVDESTPAMTLGIFSANATKISGITVMDIQDLVPPGDTKFTFIINGVVGPSVSKVIAPKCESPFANCLNGGTCGDDGTCVCAGSFSGDRCSISACSSLGCDEKNSIECSFNEGDSSCTCIGDDDSLELFDDAKCVSPSVCVEKVQCKNGGHVIGDVNPSDYNVTSCGCSCLDNYSGDRCEACKFELPGFCVNGAPRKGCSGCACNKGFTGETCACRFIAATIPLKMNMFVDVTNKQSPATRLFFREVGLALQSAVTSDATIIIAAAKYKGTTSLHVTFVITLASCDSFLILGTAEDEKQALLLAVTRIKNAMLDGKLNQNLPAGSWISAEAKLTVDDDVPCEGPECSESGGSSLSTGAIIGIAVGCAVAGVFIAFIVLSCLCGWLCFSKGQTSSSSSQEVQMSATNQI